MSRMKLVLVLSVASILSAPLAMAGTQVKSVSERVRYEDLNLQHPAGATALYKRLRSAAKRVCSVADQGALYSRQAYRQCVSTAVEAAVSDVDLPALTELYRSKNAAYDKVAAVTQ